MLESATKVIAAAKACVKSGGIDPNKLRLYTDYVIARVGTVDIVYVGMTSNYTARKKAHTGKRFPKSMFTMMPVATGLNRNKARALEQILITAYGLDTLINMINSIAPKKWEFFLSEFGQMLTLIDSWLDPE